MKIAAPINNNNRINPARAAHPRDLFLASSSASEYAGALPVPPQR